MADDLRQRYAEALAAKFTEPIYRCDKDGENEWVENPGPADRVEQTPRIVFMAGDGHNSFRMPTCLELGEVVAAVRDEELERLKERAEKAERRTATTEATISRIRELADVYELNAGTVDGVAARNFFELFAAELRDALNPPPALLAEEETGRHGQP